MSQAGDLGVGHAPGEGAPVSLACVGTEAASQWERPRAWQPQDATVWSPWLPQVQASDGPCEL